MVLEDFGAALGQKGVDSLERVRAAATRMSELIDDLLALARVGKDELRRSEVDLSALAESVGAGLQRTHPDRSVELVVSPAIQLNADPRLLRVVLENLLGNAWKFSARRPRARVEVLPVTRDGQPGFIVRDNGAGFDMEHAARLFAPFERLHVEDEFPGTGIGLATVQRIVDRHGGKVWAESGVGEGATFGCTFPPRPSATAELSALERRVPHHPERHG